jgi:flagellin
MANAITLTSGMRKNLFSLQNTEKLLQTTQTRLATGLRVQKAVDDPINYFTALEHRQRADDLSTRKDEMSESIQLVNAANDGVESINALIASAKSLAQSALSESGTQLQSRPCALQYDEVLNQIDNARGGLRLQGHQSAWKPTLNTKSNLMRPAHLH